MILIFVYLFSYRYWSNDPTDCWHLKTNKHSDPSISNIERRLQTSGRFSSKIRGMLSQKCQFYCLLAPRLPIHNNKKQRKFETFQRTKEEIWNRRGVQNEGQATCYFNNQSTSRTVSGCRRSCLMTVGFEIQNIFWLYTSTKSTQRVVERFKPVLWILQSFLRVWKPCI